MIVGSGIPKANISISIKETKAGGKRLASLNSNQYRTPASIAKVATTYVALLSLGDAYRWQTKIYTNGDIYNGVLDGDLVIKGFGDPTLNTKSIDKIIGYIQTKGIERITGNIVLDKSYFETTNECSAMFDENPTSAYNSMPSAIMFNDNTTTIKIVNGSEVVQNIEDDSYDIINEVVLTDESCKRPYSWPSVNVQYGERSKVKLSGKLSKNCPPIPIKCIITQPYNSFYGSLKSKLKESGISYNGTMKLKKVPNNSKELTTIYSEPIFEIIGHTNKKSDNMYARQIFLSLGAKEYGSKSTVKKSREALRAILERDGVRHSNSFKLDNGSGLSRTAKVTTQSYEAMLDNAYIRYGQKWLNSLSIAGVDGTIKSRFPSSLSRRVWMKTGTVKHVKNIVGYVRANDGRLYTVVIIINDSKSATKGAALENTIISWVANSNASQYLEVDSISEPRGETKEVIRQETNNLPQFIEKKSIEKVAIVEQNITSEPLLYVQVAIFDKNPDMNIVAKLRNNGFGYKTYKTPSVQKLVAGPFGSKQEAVDALEKIRTSIASDAFIVKY